MAKSILHTIERNMPTFSKGQKRIADYILQNYDKAADYLGFVPKKICE